MSDQTHTTALFAGGCFWCIGADIKKVPSVSNAISGYAGGTTENPTYENYARGGHREVVKVTYDSAKTSYEELIMHFIKSIDPTDAGGSFHDRGFAYSPAIYYETQEEKNTAEKVLKDVEAMKIYDKPLTVEVLPRAKFWPAEEYHQDYDKKNPAHYGLYRQASGRDAFTTAHRKGYEKK
jgi:peptide methionine sulfoxide reductase msrA/msrB